jgi:hypothetical protein
MWCFPLEAPPTIRCLQVAVSEDRDQAFYIKGALNIFYFFKELCEFYTHWEVVENVFNFAMFTNDLFITCLLK